MADFEDNEVNFNLADHLLLQEINPPMCNELQNLVLGNDHEDPKDIVLVGEGNDVFTLSLVLSILRDGHNGIDVASTVRQPDTHIVKNKAGDNCPHQYPEYLNDIATVDMICANAHIIDDLQNLDGMPNVANKVVWLECPEYWDIKAGCSIMEFMKKITNYQENGNYLVIKIYPSFFIDPMMHFLYTLAATTIGYWLHGKDESLIQDIIAYGGYEDTQCLLLVFRKGPVDTCKEDDIPTEPSCSYSVCIDEISAQ